MAAQSARYSAKTKKAASHGSELTEDEIRAVQSLDRKSLNELTGEEMQKLYPVAEKYYHQMGEKSPFFRAWFGDWRVNDQTEVQIAAQEGSARGLQHNVDTGWDINVSGKTFSETKSHTKSINRSAIPYLDYINDIVRNAVLLDTYTIGKAKSPNSLLMHSMYTVADIGNGPEILKLYVEEMFDPNRVQTGKRAYQLQNIEKSTAYSQSSGEVPSSLLKTADIKTVSDLFAAVKQRDRNFLSGHKK